MLLIQVCGIPAFVAITITGCLLTATALGLALKFKRESLLTSFLPMCMLPFFVSLWFGTFELANYIDFQFAAEQIATEQIEQHNSAFQLTMNLFPLVFGAFVSAVPASVIVISRWMIAWKAAGLRWIPEPKKPEKTKKELREEARREALQEAEDYVERLARPK